jgi:hypothetical protein
VVKAASRRNKLENARKKRLRNLLARGSGGVCPNFVVYLSTGLLIYQFTNPSIHPPYFQLPNTFI